MRGDCSFCRYWWNWWPSLFKLSFHNHEIKSLSFKKIVLKKTTGTNGFIFRLLAPGQAENFLISICLLLLHHFNNNYGLIWFMVFNATLNNISATEYCGGQFYWWKKLEYSEKTTDLSQVTGKSDHISSTPRHERDSLTTSVVIDTDCTGICKSNYHTITTTTPLILLYK